MSARSELEDRITDAINEVFRQAVGTNTNHWIIQGAARTAAPRVLELVGAAMLDKAIAV